MSKSDYTFSLRVWLLIGNRKNNKLFAIRYSGLYQYKSLVRELVGEYVSFIAEELTDNSWRTHRKVNN